MNVLHMTHTHYLQAAVVRACRHSSSHHGQNISHSTPLCAHSFLLYTHTQPTPCVHNDKKKIADSINPMHQTDRPTRATLTASRSRRGKRTQPAAEQQISMEVGVKSLRRSSSGILTEQLSTLTTRRPTGKGNVMRGNRQTGRITTTNIGAHEVRGHSPSMTAPPRGP